MKYIAKNQTFSNVSDCELLETLLQQRGVVDTKTFLNLTPEVIHDGMLFENMEWGLKLLNYHMNKGNKIHIITDSDCDGHVSAALTYQYIKQVSGIECTFSLHQGKQHGVTKEVIKGYDFDLLIVPDAGSGDKEMCSKLADEGKDVLVLDHHSYNKDNLCACVINCHDGAYPNNTLCGVGVTYKFCREYDKKYGFNYANDYLDLVALGSIGDSMDLRNPETRFYTLEGLKRFGQDNLFLSELMEKQSYSMGGKSTIMSVGWFIAPIINGVVRMGEMEDKINMFKALIGSNETMEHTPRKSKNNPNPTMEVQTIQKAMVRICVGIKAKQDREVKKGVEKVVDKIKEQGLENNKIIIVDVTEELSQTFTGLVANKLANQYKRPCLLLRDKKNNSKVSGGSGRGYSRFALDNLREFLLESELFESVLGHSSAFGCSIDKSNIKAINTYANDKLKHIEIEDCYHVDFEIPIARVKEEHIMQVGQWKDMWGNSLHEPTFAITNIRIDSEEIKLLGEKKSFIKFEVVRGNNKVTFIKKYTNEEYYNKIIHKTNRGLTKGGSKKLELTVIGKFVINEWSSEDGRVFFTPQIEVIEIESKIATNKVLF